MSDSALRGAATSWRWNVHLQFLHTAVYERAKDGVLQMTPSELQLFIGGNEAGGGSGSARHF